MPMSKMFAADVIVSSGRINLIRTFVEKSDSAHVIRKSETMKTSHVQTFFPGKIRANQ